MRKTIRILSIFIGVAISPVATAQWRFIYRSEDILTASTDTLPNILSIESRGAFSKYFVVRLANRRKTLVLKKSVWGYIDGNNRIWRSYDKDSYLLTKYNGGWVEYAANRLVNPRNLNITYMQPMFSRTLDSPIHASWRAAMSDIPPSFILKRSIPN